MRSRNSSLWGILCLVLVYGAAETAHAKSVYALSNHSTSNIRVYDIIGDQINFRTQSNEMSGGAIDLAASFEEEVIFASFDGSNKFELINSKTLEYIKSISVSPEMAGLVYSQTYNLLFSAERYGSNIHAYSYDPDTQSLNEEAVIELDNVSGIYGICLDEEDMLFYLCESESYVKYYNLQVQNNEPDLVYAGKVDIKLNAQSKIAVGATVYNDGSGTKYLYTTGYNHEAGGQQHNYVIRTSLTDPNEMNGRVGVELDSMAVDADIDLDTGYLYLTVYDNSLQVYDSLSWTTDPNDCEYTDIDTEGYSGPAGVIIGSQYKTAPPGLHFDKTAQIENDNTCVSPVDPNADEITYEIFYWNQEDDDNEPNYLGTLDVVIVDYLPDEIDPNEVTVSDDGVYDSQTNMVTWEIGTLAPGDNGSVTIEVKVIESAEPADVLTNSVEIESQMYYKKVTVDTDICCWGGDIIYVRAPGEPNAPSGVGTSWDDAYTDLQDALARAARGCGSEIWVAAGTYSPGDNTTDTFEIPHGIVLYGGLAGNENPDFDPNSREAIQYKSILTGMNDSGKNDKIVTMSQNTKLHGFVLEEADVWGIFGTEVDFTVEKCAVENNGQDGIRCQNGNLAINWCIVKDNDNHGIYSSGSGKNLIVNNSIISYNGENGIYCFNSTATIKNSMIFYNGEDGTVYYGVKLENPSDNPVIRNCTIADNINEGIYYTGSNAPDISNSIIWHNNADNGYFQLSEHCPVPTYSCITDPNDPEGEDPGADEPDEETGNIGANPYFAYTDPNLADYHLDPCSPCVDAGDPCDSYDGEKDIDGDDRVLNGVDYSPDNGRVDMGADEVACDEIYNSLDWNINAIVDIEDLIILANAWLSDPNATNWNDRCDLNSDDIVNWVDFAAFGIEWLWQPCWASSGTGMWMMMGGDWYSGSMLMTETEPTIEEHIIAQLKEAPNWLEEVEDQTDYDTWIGIVTSLERMLKELEDSQ